MSARPAVPLGIFWLALKSAWRAGVEQFKRKREQLRRASMPPPDGLPF